MKKNYFSKKEVEGYIQFAAKYGDVAAKGMLDRIASQDKPADNCCDLAKAINNGTKQILDKQYKEKLETLADKL